jgi:hypothetical protein
MDSALLLDLTDARDAPWRAALERSGVHLGAACEGHKLVQCTIDASATRLVCLASRMPAELAAALSGWDGAPPLSVLLLTPPGPVGVDDARRALACGVHHWQALHVAADGAVAAADIESAIALAEARRSHDEGLRRSAARAQEQLDERKWVDRAKGVLMAARGLGEDAAFGLLRGAAMSVNLRIGELARGVCEAAWQADAMNRAGQLRMLSQRLVRLAAQRLLGIAAREGAALAAESIQRVRDNLSWLEQRCAHAAARPACAHAQRCWQALAQALDAPRLDAAALQRIDALADAMLDAAEALTDVLQQACGRRALHVVNQCGRQRMRVQRLAKDSLLGAALATDVDPRSALAAFEAVQRELEDAPLTSPEIRATLAAVRDDWARLAGAVDARATGPGRRTLVRASEALLARLDALTAAYEHSLQVLMG